MANPGNQMDVDEEEVEAPSSSTSKSGEKKRFEVKKVPRYVTIAITMSKSKIINF